MKTPLTLDLFAGAGGLSLGFQAEGCRCMGAVDLDAVAMDTFHRNLADDRTRLFAGPNGDVNQLPVETLQSAIHQEFGHGPDLIIGGPPCQEFSRIGRAKHRSLVKDETERTLHGGQRDPGKNQLYQYFLDAVRLMKPVAFVMENVPGMRDRLGSDYASRAAREAAACGYNVRYFLLNAADYGVPQQRWRLFFVGIRHDIAANTMPTPPHRTHRGGRPLDGTRFPEDTWMLAGDQIPAVEPLDPEVAAAEALGDLPKLKEHLRPGARRVEDRPLPYRGSPSKYAALMREWPGFAAGKLVEGNWYRFTNPKRDPPIFAQMAEGDRYPDAIRIANERFEQLLSARRKVAVIEVGSRDYEQLKADTIPPYRNDAFDDKWRKLYMDRPAWTVTAHLSRDSYSHIHYDSRQARMVSVREAARLQSFPDAFRFAGSYGDQFRQIGNAVPPLLARAVARQVLADINKVRHRRRTT